MNPKPLQSTKEIDIRDDVRDRTRVLHVLWFECLLALLRRPNKLDFFLALSTLRLLPLVELRFTEGGWC